MARSVGIFAMESDSGELGDGKGRQAYGLAYWVGKWLEDACVKSTRKQDIV